MTASDKVPEDQTADFHEFTVFPGRPAERVRRGDPAPFGWWPAACIALVAAVDRIEYNLLAGALPKIQEEFGFGDAAAGGIATAGSIAAVVLLLPAGRLADRAHRTKTVAAVVAVWAVLTVGTGLAAGYATLFAVRVLLGAAGQLYNPPASSLLADFHPGSGRGRAFGFERMAYFGGLPIGVIAGGALAEYVGWRVGFFLVALPGIVVALLVLTLREPLRGTGDRLTVWYQRPPGEPTAEAPAPEPTAPASPTPEPSARRQIGELLAIPTLRSVVAGLSIVFFGLGGLFYWMPSFYDRKFGLGEADAAAVAGGAGLIGIVAGIILGSRLGDRHHGVRPGWRITLGGAGLVLGTCALAGAVASPVLAPQVGCFALANFGFAIALANLTAANADVVAAQRRGLGFAVLQMVMSLAGSLGPWLIGMVSDATGSLGTAFAVVLVPLAAGCVVVLRARSTYDADASRALARSVASDS
ncbi:MFS transporter [Streptomyces sp. BE230]|uniref:MFS transporter n=1 Tax=Streptomyces sp. BE230 TaxID=3002526 RepID=UPI002ED1B5D6|nr:MFS transporter [Streptomyces sp. BE230]